MSLEVLDAISFGVFSFLKAHPRVSHVDHTRLAGATSIQIALWNQRNQPHVLPDDLHRFFIVSNGLSIKWFAHLRGHALLTGHFSLNGVQDLRKIRLDDFTELCRPADRHRLGHIQDDAVTAYLLDSQPKIGEVALVFFFNTCAGIWLRGVHGTWGFLATSFSNYYRMMLAHFGLVAWQTIFSDDGLDPIHRPWFYLFVPQRMAIDEKEGVEPIHSSKARDLHEKPSQPASS